MKALYKILIALSFMLFFLPTLAQEEESVDQTPMERDPKAREKIEAARIGMISNKLGLTPVQAEKFWPIYREFTQKRMDLRNEFRTEQGKIKPENQSPEDQKKLVDLGFNLKQKELDLEKMYSGRLLKVISAEQMLNLRTAERDFHRMIIQQLQQRRDIQHRRENLKDRNQMLRQKRN